SAIAAGASDLLVIGLDGLRHRVVQHEADVRAVNAHAEGVGGGDDVERAGLELLLDVCARVAVHAGVVVLRAPATVPQRLGDGLGVAARAGIDERGAAPAA